MYLKYIYFITFICGIVFSCSPPIEQLNSNDLVGHWVPVEGQKYEIKDSSNQIWHRGYPSFFIDSITKTHYRVHFFPIIPAFSKKTFFSDSTEYTYEYQPAITYLYHFYIEEEKERSFLLTSYNRFSMFKDSIELDYDDNDSSIILLITHPQTKKKHAVTYQRSNYLLNNEDRDTDKYTVWQRQKGGERIELYFGRYKSHAIIINEIDSTWSYSQTSAEWFENFRTPYLYQLDKDTLNITTFLPKEMIDGNLVVHAIRPNRTEELRFARLTVEPEKITSVMERNNYLSPRLAMNNIWGNEDRMQVVHNHVFKHKGIHYTLSPSKKYLFETPVSKKVKDSSGRYKKTIQKDFHKFGNFEQLFYLH